jgi:hypothetical protein
MYLYAGYELNKNYIAAVLCENKAKPKLHCNGKCYLAKKLKQAENSQQKQEQSSSKHFFADHFLITGFKFKSYIRQTAVYTSCEIKVYYSLGGNSIFHPPQA